jgi:hypothetical protein
MAATAQSSLERVISANCATLQTAADGSRPACDSKHVVLHASADHAFAQNSLQGGEVEGEGSEHECRFGWDNFVEVIPKSGITQPTTLWIQAHARSPTGIGLRGRSTCSFSVKQFSYRSPNTNGPNPTAKAP